MGDTLLASTFMPKKEPFTGPSAVSGPRQKPKGTRLERMQSGLRDAKKEPSFEEGIRPIDHDTDPDVFLSPEGSDDVFITEEMLAPPEMEPAHAHTASKQESSNPYPDTPEEARERLAREAQQARDIPLYQARIRDLSERRSFFLNAASDESTPPEARVRARIEAANLKKQIDALLPPEDVQREHQALKQRQLEHWNQEFDRLNAVLNDNSAHYILRMEARKRLLDVIKKIKALEALGVEEGKLRPTAKGLSNKIFNAEARAKQREVTSTEQETSPLLDDLYLRYNNALRVSQDPKATIEEKRKARNLFAHLLSRIEQDIKLLPQYTEKQRKRKKALEATLEPWLQLSNTGLDWADSSLLPLFKAQMECEQALTAISADGRSDEAIYNLEQKVQAFRQALLELKGDPSESRSEITSEQDRIRQELHHRPSTTPSGETTDLPFWDTAVTPLPKTATSRERIDRYLLLEERARAEEAALEAKTSAQKDSSGNIFTSLSRALQLYEHRVKTEIENQSIKIYPEAVPGLRDEHSLDDIARIRELRGEIGAPSAEPPIASIPQIGTIKSVAQMRQERFAAQKSHLESKINGLKRSLIERFGKKDLALVKGTFSPSIWGRVKDLWHRAVTKDYVSNAELISSYKNTTRELAELETRQDPAQEVTASRLLKIERAKFPAMEQALLSRDTSPEEKMATITHYRETSAALDAFVPDSFDDRLLKKQMIEEVQRLGRVIGRYQNDLKRNSLNIIDEIQRAKLRNPERLPVLFESQRTLLAREWEATAPMRLLKEKGTPALAKRIAVLREAHELEYQIAKNPLLERTARSREKNQARLKKFYDLVYDRAPEKRWFERRVA